MIPSRQSHSALVVLIMLAFFALPSLGAAQTYSSQLRCLENARGKHLRWQSGWAKDNLDQGVQYKVVRSKAERKPPQVKITLKLEAVGKAKKKNRTLTAEYEDAARPVCEALFVKKTHHSLPMSDEIADRGSELPFIKHTSSGWVRATAPRNKKLAECVIVPNRFSCLKEDKVRWGITLKSVEEELNWQVP